MVHDLLSQVELLEAACHHALKTDHDTKSRDALVLALGAFAIAPHSLSLISRPYITGLVNMVRAHADHLMHKLKTTTEDSASGRSLRIATEQVCQSLAELGPALKAQEKSADPDGP